MLGWKRKKRKVRVIYIEMKLKTKEDITILIKKDKWMLKVLKIIKKLKLGDWWIGAGFVMNKGGGLST